MNLPEGICSNVDYDIYRLKWDIALFKDEIEEGRRVRYTHTEEVFREDAGSRAAAVFVALRRVKEAGGWDAVKERGKDE